MMYFIHCDGSCYNHPDHNTMGFAAVLSHKFNPEMYEVKQTRTGWDKEGTNNIAEWLALIAGMELMFEHSNEIDRVDCYEIYTDSNLVVGQANGKFRVRNEGLRPYYKRFRELEKKCKNIDFGIFWTSRKNNGAADQYSKIVNPHFKNKIKNEIRPPEGDGGPKRPYQPGHRSIEDQGKPKGRSGRGFRFA